MKTTFLNATRLATVALALCLQLSPKEACASGTTYQYKEGEKIQVTRYTNFKRTTLFGSTTQYADYETVNINPKGEIIERVVSGRTYTTIADSSKSDYQKALALMSAYESMNGKFLAEKTLSLSSFDSASNLTPVGTTTTWQKYAPNFTYSLVYSAKPQDTWNNCKKVWKIDYINPFWMPGGTTTGGGTTGGGTTGGGTTGGGTTGGGTTGGGTTGGGSTGGGSTGGGGTANTAKPIISSTFSMSVGPITQRGATSDLTARIDNIGNATLLLSGTPSIRLSGTDAAQFSVTVQPATSISAGSYTRYTVRYAPTASGTHNATATITSNDPAKPTYTCAIKGTANLPAAEISYFEWYYGSSLRVWQRSGSVWTERSPNGSVETFDSVGNGGFGSATFILVRSRKDSKKEILIPNLPYAATNALWYRYNNGAWGTLSSRLYNFR